MNHTPPLSPEREKKLRAAVKKRQPNITVILENVYDRHNIAAVIRTAEMIGICEIYVLYSEKNVEEIEISKRSSGGAKKWVDIHLYNDLDACFKKVRTKYEKIYATHLGKSAVSIYDLDMSSSVALLFGNENKGLTEEALNYADGNMLIPQAGMSQSLNVSVACAVTLYEAYRQRNVKGYYENNPLMTEAKQQELYGYYLERNRTKGYNLYVKMVEDR